MIIISGYQGVGKSTFAKETHEEKFGRKITSIDLESSNYDKTNKEWYKEYVKDVLSIKDVDIIFISSHQSVRDELNKQKVRFYFVLPYAKNKHEWTEMLAKRVQSSIDNEDEREKNIRALMSHILYYDAVVDELRESHNPFVKSIRPWEEVESISDPSHLKYLLYRLVDRQDIIN